MQPFQNVSEIKLRVHRLIEDRLGVQKSAIKDSASFYEDLNVDSLDFCELIVDVEKEFNIQIADDVYEKLKTVAALENYITRSIHTPV